MFILSLTYLKGTEEADQYMQPHLDWLQAGYERGLFLASGRKVPRTGGVIFAHGGRADIEALIAADPFTLHGVCTYEITEVAVTRVAGGGLDALKS